MLDSLDKKNRPANRNGLNPTNQKETAKDFPYEHEAGLILAQLCTYYNSRSDPISNISNRLQIT